MQEVQKMHQHMKDKENIQPGNETVICGRHLTAPVSCTQKKIRQDKVKIFGAYYSLTILIESANLAMLQQ